MRRRSVAKVVISILLVATILATVAPVLADDAPIPSDGAGLTIDGIDPTDIPLPPAPQGRPTGDRLYVRTSAATPTEYLMMRAAIYEAGLLDVLEVSPGSLIVATGNMSTEDATALLTTIDGVVEIVPAPPYRSPEGTAIPVALPTWWWFAIISLLVAAGSLTVAMRSRRSSQD